MLVRETSSKKSAARPSLREELLGEMSAEEFGRKKRHVSVMTRMSADVVEFLDNVLKGVELTMIPIGPKIHVGTWMEARE